MSDKNYELCNYLAVHPDKSVSFCFKPVGHDGEHQPGGFPPEHMRAEIQAAIYAHLTKADQELHRIPQSKEGLDELREVINSVCAKYVGTWEISLGPELTPE